MSGSNNCNKSNDRKWNCTSCTFLNEANRNRCLMCHAHRARSVINSNTLNTNTDTAESNSNSNGNGNRSHKGSDKATIAKRQPFDENVLDFTTKMTSKTTSKTTTKATSRTAGERNSSNSTAVNNDHSFQSLTNTPMIASTDSARKRRKKRKLTENNNSFGIAINKNGCSTSPYYNIGSNIDYNVEAIRMANSGVKNIEKVEKKMKKKESLETKKKGSKTSSTNAIALLEDGKSSSHDLDKTERSYRKKNSHSFMDKNSSIEGREINENDTQNKFNKNSSHLPNSNERSHQKLSFSSSSAKSSKPTSRSRTTAKVQKTLFDTIVRNIKETNVNENNNENQFQVNDSSKKRQQKSHQAKLYPEIEMIPSSSSSSSAYTQSKSSQLIQNYISQPQPLTYDQLYSKAIHNLQKIFKIKSLRNLQPKAIETVLQSESQIIIMATGGGKSLCYQLPATILQGITIVLSPLIALMMDQVNNLRSKGVEAVHISSMNTAKENAFVLKRLLGEENDNSGANKGKKKQTKSKVASEQQRQLKKIKLVYCTPESIRSVRFRAVLTKLYERNQLSLIALDEAHCLSTWGHEFRPAYRKLCWLRSAFPDVPFMVRHQYQYLFTSIQSQFDNN